MMESGRGGKHGEWALRHKHETPLFGFYLLSTPGTAALVQILSLLLYHHNGLQTDLPCPTPQTTPALYLPTLQRGIPLDHKSAVPQEASGGGLMMSYTMLYLLIWAHGTLHLLTQPTLRAGSQGIPSLHLGRITVATPYSPQML